MFGIKNLFGTSKTNTTTIPIQQPLLNQEDLDAVLTVLSKVGLDVENDCDFTYHLLRRNNYAGGSLEWVLHEEGVRYFIHKPVWADEVTRITVVRDGASRFTSEQVETANQELINILDR